MKKKAFLFAVGDYGGKAPDLKAAVPEVRNWEKLLRLKFGFMITGVLEDAAATRDAVLDGYEALLKGAEPNDQLLFVGICHGTVAPVPNDDGEHAFVLSPGNDLRSAVVTFGDLMRRLVKRAPPRLVDLTHIVESCFSGEHDNPKGDPNVIALFIPPEQIFGPAAKSLSTKRVRTLSSMMLALDGSADMAQPLIVAAAGPKQSAFQVPVKGTPRLLFSMRAIERLERLKVDETLRYFEWLQQIKPLRPGFPQEPQLLNNEARMGEPFPGISGDAPIPIVSPRPSAPRTAAAELSNGGSAVSTLKVDVEGICCFVEVAGGRRRVVLPLDNMGHGHIAFLEIATMDIDSITGDMPSVSNYFHYWHGPNGPMPGTTLYYRWHLDGHALTFSNVDHSGSFTIDPQYDKHVPQMKQVLPELDATPRAECYMLNPPPSMIAAYADFSFGSLSLGPLEEDPLYFDPLHDWAPERPPKWVSVTLPLTAPPSTITIVRTADESVKTQINVKPGAQSVRFGNLPEDDITRLGSGVGTSQDYLLYYRLSGKPLSEKPVPAVQAVPINSCSVTDWP